MPNHITNRMTYEAFRVGYQNSEQAARAAFQSYEAALLQRDTLKAELSARETHPVIEFLELGEDLENKYPFLYVEIARTRATGWMAWLCTHNKETHPDREVIVSAQGSTAKEACKKALQEYQAKTNEKRIICLSH